jgi:hypothetical protein
MKKFRTRFFINDEIFIGIYDSIEDCYKYYDSNYKSKGFILDKLNENVYKDFDYEIQLNEGDRVDLEGLRIVNWKCVNIDKSVVIYNLCINDDCEVTKLIHITKDQSKEKEIELCEDCKEELKQVGISTNLSIQGTQEHFNKMKR